MHYFLKFIFGIKLYMFRTVPLSITRSYSLYTQQWYMSYRFADSLQAGSGMVYVIQVLLTACEQDQDVRPDPARKLILIVRTLLWIYQLNKDTPKKVCILR